MSAATLYPKSTLCAVQALSARYAGFSKRFDKAALDQRSSELAQFVVDRWPLTKLSASRDDQP